MLILSRNDVQRSLPMAEAIKAMKAAYAALTGGDAKVPLRSSLTVPPHGGTSLFMPAFVKSDPSALTIKVVSVFPENTRRNLPVIHAAVLVLEVATGRPLALLEGGSLTAIRTGAASGAATDLLARPKSKVVTIFGAGIQGRTQLEAVCEARKIKTVWIVDLDRTKARIFVDEMAGVGRIPTDIRLAADPAEAVAHSDIICTATNSAFPVYPAEAVQPGTHINGVGSYTLDMLENPPEIHSKAIAFVDSRTAVLAESGETVAAIDQGLLAAAELTELGEIILGEHPGRTDRQEITFFKSVGVAVQDSLAAHLALDNALKLGLGQQVTW